MGAITDDGSGSPEGSEAVPLHRPRFHLELIGLVNNSRLTEIVARFRDETRLFGLPKLQELGFLEVAARDHEVIIKALSEKNGKGAAIAMRAHLGRILGTSTARPGEDERELGETASGDSLTLGEQISDTEPR